MFAIERFCNAIPPLRGTWKTLHHNSLAALVRTENVLSELLFPCSVLPLSGCVTTIHRKRVETPEWQWQKLQQMGSRWKLGKGREHRIG